MRIQFLQSFILSKLLKILHAYSLSSETAVYIYSPTPYYFDNKFCYIVTTESKLEFKHYLSSLYYKTALLRSYWNKAFP